MQKARMAAKEKKEIEIAGGAKALAQTPIISEPVYGCFCVLFRLVYRAFGGWLCEVELELEIYRKRKRRL